MANVDKGRSKWEDNSQGDQEMRLKDDMKGSRRGKPQVELYRPGSGPLRKSAQGDNEGVFFDSARRSKSSIENSLSGSISDDFKRGARKPNHSVSQEHLNRTSKRSSESRDLTDVSKNNRELMDIDDKMRNTYVSAPGPSSRDRRNSLGHVTTGAGSKAIVNDTKRKTRKPEQALYVPKPLAQAIAERDVANKSPVDNLDSKISSNTNCFKEKNSLRGEKDYTTKPVQEECWDDDIQQSYPLPDQSSKDSRLQRSENWDRNGGLSVTRGESFRRNKYEGGRKGGREKEWVDRDIGNGSAKQSGVGKCIEGKSHSMRYSGNRRNCHINEAEMKGQDFNHLSSWNSEASVSSHSYQRRNDFSREIRQASEPRALPPTSLPLDVNRMRDTRSVEPAGRGWNGEKLQSKPPSGRRGSMKDCTLPPNITKTSPKPHMCYESLPPRLKKKFLAENMAANTSYIGTTSEDVWDGSTVTFQGSGGSYQHIQPLQHVLPQQDDPVQQQSFPEWSHTLPNPRTRGRGRLRPEELEMEKMVSAVARFSRSLTPDRLSMTSPTLSCTGPHSDFRRVPSQESMRGVNRVKSPPPPVSSPPPPQPLSLQPPPVSKAQVQEERRGISSKPSGSHSGRYRKRSDSNPTEAAEIYQNRKRNENKPQTKGNVSKPQEVSAASSSTDVLQNLPSPKLLDWGEEVEQTERLEAEGILSDVMTRSSSLASLQDKTQTHPPRERRRRRRRRGGGDASGDSHLGDDRSLSRERSTRNQSKDRNRGFSGDCNNRGSSRERTYRSHQNRGGSKERSNRGPSRERNGIAENKDLDYRERSLRPQSKERNMREDERNFRGHSQDGGYRGQPRDGSNRGHSRDRNYRGQSRDRNIRGQSREKNNRGQSRERTNKVHGNKDDRPRGNSRDRSNRSQAVDQHHEKEMKETAKKHENWREEQRQYRRENKETESTQLKDVQKSNNGNQVAGILVIPPQNSEHNVQQNQMQGFGPPQDQLDYSGGYPAFRGVPLPNSVSFQSQQQRQLFDPNNPSKPIIVSSPGARATQNLHPRDGDISPSVPASGFVTNHAPEFGYVPYPGMPHCSDQGAYVTDQFGNTRPTWYDLYSNSFRSARNPHLLLEIERADLELQWIINTGGVLRDWSRVACIRQFLQQCLHTLLVQDIKFCQTENVEQHFWKILFYNIIELLRKGVTEDAENKEQYKQTMLTLIEQGTTYFENLLEALEQTYKFKLETFLSPNNVSTKGLGFAGLALVSAQKIFIFLGDLARYKEQVNETSNFGKSRQCYIKAHQLNPKNGRPYNQLAILAVYARRKLDAVYYYMRSLMASNPFQSARESLLSLFDESRKKYEQAERKRREERDVKNRERMKEKEGAGMESGGNGLRREYWVHPEAGRPRLHITTSTVQDQRRNDSEEEELATLSSIEVNKRFVTSYLHVHGKLFTKVGMETFQEAALQMLREFRALLQHSPVPLNANRFLQLLALNMFAIENTQLKEAAHLEPGYRSAVQESALVVSLQMFNLILEKCVSLLREQLDNPAETQPSRLIVSEDLQILLPAVKVWCDWLLCHSSVWNPPPSCVDYRVGPPGDPWSRVASLVNLLEKLEHHKTVIVTGPREDFDLVRLPEDATLCGFTPLMYNDQEPIYTSKETDMELAQVVLRIRKIVFFGTVFLCGVDPPVLKLHKFDGGFSEYVSVVQSIQGSPSSLHEDQSDSEIVVESFSEDEDENKESNADPKSPISKEADPEARAEIQNLLHRKEELERRHRKQEKHRQRVQEILRDSVVSVEIEVKPHNLVPDTNCFIDYLSQLQILARAGPAPEHYYTLMVPLVVLKELEGLARGGKDRDHIPVPAVDTEHAAKVAEAAKQALAFLRSRCPGVRCVTTRGTVIPTSAFAMEEDTEQVERNDDKILATSLSLCKTSGKEQNKPGEPRRLYREVVLLTEDRNLRVKALARHVPVREVPDFMQWAGLG